MKLEKIVIDEFENRLSKIPKPYTSIQVRNTDYQCDFKKLYNDNKEKIHNAYTTVNVSGSTYAIRKFSKPYRFSTSLSRDLRGGTNFSKNKKIDYWRVGNASADVLVSTIAEAFGDFDKWNVTASHNDNSALTTKTKQTWKFSNEAIQDKIASFFNVYKTSVSKNPGTFWENESLEIVNLHNDVYGPDKERPMQGPFTEKHVGGLQHLA